MKLYTSYFDNVKYILNKANDAILISIAGKTPSFVKKYTKNVIMHMKELMPLKTWWSEWYKLFASNANSRESIEWYADKYLETVISHISPEKIIKQLKSINNSETAIFVFFCYEKPADFCHRQIFREWFNRTNYSKQHKLKIKEFK